MRFVWTLDQRVPVPAAWGLSAAQQERPRTASKRYRSTQTNRARRAQQLATHLPPLRRRGRPRKGDNVPFPATVRGNSAAYRAALLRRDHPEIAAALAAGQFASVSAAWRAATMVVVATRD